MKALVKFVIAILLIFVAAFVIVGPGRLVAGAEYPMGVGPWGSTGRYCQDMYSLTHLVDVWHGSDVPATTEEKVTFRALQKALTESGPAAPQAPWVAFFGPRGFLKAKVDESALNKWWNQNCTQTWMEAPSSLNRTWSGMLGRETFTHYPKNVVDLKNFFKVITGLQSNATTS
jgi:hypothetical protein